MDGIEDWQVAGGVLSNRTEMDSLAGLESSNIHAHACTTSIYFY